MARQGEAAPLYSSFLHLHFIFQILSDKQLLSEYNLSCCSFWETYLTTSDPQHKGWTYISYLSCSRKLLRKSFHLCLFLKFLTQIEEYLLKNTVFIFESSPPRQMVYVSTPLSLLLPRSLLLSHIPQFWSVLQVQQDVGMSLGERERGPQQLAAAARITGSRKPGKMMQVHYPSGSPEWDNSKKQHWAPLVQSLLSASQVP